MATDGENWLVLIFSRNYRILLLTLITLMFGVLVFWSVTEPKVKTTPQSHINTDDIARDVAKEIKVSLEALPPIPVKVILEQKINVTESKPKPAPDHKPWDFNWDLRKPDNSDEEHNRPSRTVYLIRHGQYNRSTGLLTALGHRQAAKTAQRLKELDRPYSNIFYSSMPRARETAQYIIELFRDVPARSDDVLQEGAPVPIEPDLPFWNPPKEDYHIDGPRLESAFRKYFYRAGRDQEYQSFDIIVAHANIIRFFVLRALQFDASGWMRLGLPHASITKVSVNPDSFVLMSGLGDSGHFPADMVTY